MWHNLWSSVETRAAIDDVAHTYLSAAGFQVGESNRMLEHDIRHFVTYTGSALEYNVRDMCPTLFQLLTF